MFFSINCSFEGTYTYSPFSDTPKYHTLIVLYPMRYPYYIPFHPKKNCTHPTSHDFTSASEPQHMFVFLLLQVLDAVSRRSNRKNVAWLPSGKPT